MAPSTRASPRYPAAARILLLGVAVFLLLVASPRATFEQVSFVAAPYRQQRARFTSGQNAAIVRRASGTDDVNAKGEGGTTPLMAAAFKGDAAEVEDLIQRGADKDAQDDYGWTALRFAIRGQRFVAAEKLLELGADANLASKTGRTPLMSAAANGFDEMVQLLIGSGADVTAKNDGGLTAYDLSLRGGGLPGMDMIREMVKC